MQAAKLTHIIAAEILYYFSSIMMCCGSENKKHLK